MAKLDLEPKEIDLILSLLLDSDHQEAQPLYDKIIQQETNQIPVKRLVTKQGVFYLTPDEINEE